MKSQISDLRVRRAAQQLACQPKCRYIAERASPEHVLSSAYNTAPISLDPISTYPPAGRKSKLSVCELVRPHRNGALLPEFLDSLPRILAAGDLRAVIAAILQAHARGRAILWGMDGHVIKVGLGPLVVDLIRRGLVQGIAMTSSTLVHDFEIALVGNTSENVDVVFGRGQFGMAEETGLYANEIAVGAHRPGRGVARLCDYWAP